MHLYGRLLTHCLIALNLCLATACHRAQQFPPLAKNNEKNLVDTPKEAENILRDRSWLEPRPTQDVPLVFVPETNEAWRHLPQTWNHSPALATLFGVPALPLQAAATLVFTEQQRAVSVKLPRGLAYMAPTFPEANPPTLGKWRLGKALFFTPLLTAGPKPMSCAHCHHPRHGFASDPAETHGARFDAPSLINVAYHRRHFWDGRAETLEETLFRSMDEERASPPEKRLQRGVQEHVWTGFVRALADDKRFDKDFQNVFGIEHPTQNAVAQALATYLRTLLSGDSLYDRAEQIRLQRNDKTLKAGHFEPVLTSEFATVLRDSVHSERPAREIMPPMLEKGYELFHGRARCAKCHHGPLFTDHDFHNTGCDENENWPIDGKETGRSLHVPIGLKQRRFVGAFRTPSLRNLTQTAPYFHNGSHADLRKVIAFYDRGILPDLPYLAQALKDGDKVQWLNLTPEEIESLVLFLRSLQGRPMDPIVTTP